MQSFSGGRRRLIDGVIVIRPVDCSRGTVLVAEDEAINRMHIVSLLEDCGFHCVTAKNGQQAVEAFRSGAFEAVLMDISMPILDGISAAKEIRRMEEAKGTHVPIIAITAHAEDEQAAVPQAKAIDAYLRKPFSESVLCETVESTLRSIAGRPTRE